MSLVVMGPAWHHIVTMTKTCEVRVYAVEEAEKLAAIQRTLQAVLQSLPQLFFQIYIVSTINTVTPMQVHVSESRHRWEFFSIPVLQYSVLFSNTPDLLYSQGLSMLTSLVSFINASFITIRSLNRKFHFGASDLTITVIGTVWIALLLLSGEISLFL